MTDIITNIILGVVQGITEWLPISSSGHLVLFEHLLGMRQDLAYDLLLHVASLLVMIYFFRTDIIRLIGSMIGKGQREDRALVGYLLITTLCTVVVALFVKPYEPVLRGLVWVALSLLVNAIFLFLTKKSKGDRVLDWRMAIMIGLAQGFAAVPAVSRSGMTIAVALMLGLPRELAFKYSFLAAMPAIAGAALLTIGDLAWSPVYIIGVITAALVGYASLRWLQRIVLRDSFHLFWIYNAALACIVLLAWKF